MIRDLFSVATLRALAAHTPAPVPTYPLSPAPSVPRTAPAVVEANGMRIEYDTFGNAVHPPLLLVMGLAGQMVAWDEEFCARLAGCGFRVIRFDNRDIGRSTWLNDAPVPNLLALIRAVRRGAAVDVPYRVPDMAQDALGLLDALGVESAHVVGVSMGGMIAQEMAIQAPHRVRTLTSIMSHTGEPDLPHPHWRAMASLLVPAPRDRDMAMRRAVAAWRVLNGPGCAIDLARTRAMAELAYDRGRNPAGVVRQIAGIIASPSRAGALRALRTPTLVMHGDLDPMVPVEGGRRTAAAIPGAALEVIPRMGHALAPPSGSASSPASPATPRPDTDSGQTWCTKPELHVSHGVNGVNGKRSKPLAPCEPSPCQGLVRRRAICPDRAADAEEQREDAEMHLRVLVFFLRVSA